MKEMINKHRESVQGVVHEYGKVIALSVLILWIGGLCLYIFHHDVKPKRLEVSFLDIGQGDSILVQTPSGHEMLIDGGGSDKVLEKMSAVTNYFNHHVDVLVATHPDADHITGLIPVLEKYDVDTIVVSPVAGHTGISDTLQKNITNEHAVVRVAKAGDQIDFGDGVVAHILYPSADAHIKESETNDASVSMVITYGDESILLTGDLPTTDEGDLLVGELPHNITIYKAGHHGSKYSSGEQLLSYIRPVYSVISAGKDNKYGHPNPEAVSRLQMYSQEILGTIEKGTISFFLDGKNVELVTDK